MRLAALVAELRARGITLQPEGDRLRVRPVSRLTRDELEALRQHKVEVLQILTPDAALAITLDPQVVREVLGPDPNAHVVACIAWDVRDALRVLEREIQTGRIAPELRLIHGRPLADWLELAELARLFRAWRGRSSG